MTCLCIQHHNGPLMIKTFSTVHTASYMMTSSNGNIFRVAGHLCGEFTDPRWISAQGQWRGALMFSLICAWIDGCVNNREAGDLRRHRAHYDVIVMIVSRLFRFRIMEIMVTYWMPRSYLKVVFTAELRWHCQFWTWLKEFKRYICKIKHITGT